MIEKHPVKKQINETVSMVGCQFCSAIFKTEEILKEHVEKTHKYNAPKAVLLLNCKFCGASFKTDGLMKEHIQRIHPEKETPVVINHGKQNKLEKEREKVRYSFFFTIGSQRVMNTERGILKIFTIALD